MMCSPPIPLLYIHLKAGFLLNSIPINILFFMPNVFLTEFFILDESEPTGAANAAGGNSPAANGGGNATTTTNYHYRLKLNFETQVFGAFKQTLIFDFGTKPLLAKVG